MYIHIICTGVYVPRIPEDTGSVEIVSVVLNHVIDTAREIVKKCSPSPRIAAPRARHPHCIGKEAQDKETSYIRKQR